MNKNMVKINLRAHLSNHGVEEKLRRIIAHVADSAKYISLIMREANRKLAGTQNSFGEDQLELDVLADDILKQRLEYETSFGIGEFASEEQDTIKLLSTNGERYSVTVDPLDGSSLVDVNLAVGTFIGIHEGKILSGKPGRETLAAAMYVVYGPLTTLVYTARNGTHEFVLDPTGNFVLSQENLTLKDSGSIYSPGGLRSEWLPKHAAFIDYLEAEGYKLRYSGGLVPDANQIISKGGGIFTYPALTSARAGKLRLLFEEQPLALIVEGAGGLATNGVNDILDLVPEALEQRSPFYMGSRIEVQMARRYLTKD
ncbi:MAG: fructose-1,6-bisphosphatase [Candidatus Poribacteria bacterium]|nr:fructose-1,6-bisphosphatase [Candidatus Poribacteria bacterium]